MLRLIAIIILTGFLRNAVAGGSYVSVQIQSLKINGNDYSLIVGPNPKYGDSLTDPYMLGCKTFFVSGTYDSIWWLTRSGPSKGKVSHKRALEELKSAYDRKEPILFGWMGSGFERIKKEDPCRVKSKALDVIEDKNLKAVISFYESV